MYNNIIWLSPFHYSFCPPLFISVFVFSLLLCVCFSYIYYFHYLRHYLSASVTVLITLRYYFISLQHTLYHLAHLVSLSSITFIITTLIFGVFYCLNYILLLLHLIIKHLVIDFIITM